jgi:glycosyltransferase involved in cell wall biosynthesis
LREEESRRGLALLGETFEVHFLRYPDRGLTDEVSSALAEHLREFRPDLVCLPSPVEIHPDHLALSRAFCELIQRDESLFADLATTRVAFYEVSQPLRPNALVDITAVAEKKYAAIAAHESQITLKDYVLYARGLNAYRAMTLPAEAKAAEGYFVTGLPQLRTTAFSELRRLTGHPTEVEVVRTEVPISVIIRTKDRPALLREAMDSVKATGYPAEVVVVNDGGARPDAGTARLVHHERSRGRSEAMNAGVRAAGSAFIAFLDDDDLFYPEHLSTLANAAANAAGQAAWYTDAVSTSLRLGQKGNWETQWRNRIFARDFDRQALLIDNYIPLTTLLVPRERFLEAGGFDPQFDLFEDWDFLIRLSQQGEFARVPRVTCEIRHFQSGDSITLAAPEGTPRFRAAKLAVWRKHAALISNDVIANVYEKQKRRFAELTAELVDQKGRSSHLHTDLQRLEREKNDLMRQIGELHQSMNEKLMYIAQLQGEVKAAGERATGDAHEIGALRQMLAETKAALTATEVERDRAQSEANRLQGLLDMIFRSKTWKMHTLLERLRGRR